MHPVAVQQANELFPEVNVEKKKNTEACFSKRNKLYKLSRDLFRFIACTLAVDGDINKSEKETRILIRLKFIGHSWFLLLC